MGLGSKKERISDNPNGLAWSQDDSKFGQKMLEKMGWTKGKGLGANENGRTDNVKVSLKTDKKGIGCTQEHADKWIDLQDEYEAILAQVSASNSPSSSGSSSQMEEGTFKKPKEQFMSLHKKSVNSRSRVHYSKYTRGKDLSSKTEEELNCIFGRRKAKPGEKKELTVETPVEKPTAPVETDKSQFGVITTTSTTNLQEYFAQKMAALRRTKSDAGLNNEPKEEQVAKEEDVPDVLSFQRVHFLLDNTEKSEKPTKKKSKKKKHETDLPAEDGDACDVKVTEDDEPVKKKKKKRKDRDAEEVMENAGDSKSDPVEIDMSTSSKQSESIQREVKHDSDSVGKKKRKRNKDREETQDEDGNDDCVKKRKRQKH